MPITIQSTSKHFSSLGGLLLANNVMAHVGLKDIFESILPKQKIKSKSSSFEKLRTLCLGFIVGAECLTDMDLLAEDNAFEQIANKVCASNTYGEFLREFDAVACKNMNLKLIETSLKLREVSHGNKGDFILDLDSTHHLQHGKKMEGVEWNYKHEWCLDSLQAYDNHGYPYWMQVRPGSTYSSNHASEVIHHIFSKLPKKQKRYFRGDSAFCNTDVFNAVRCAEGKFVIAMKANIYEPLLKSGMCWNQTSKIKFLDNRECEIGQTIYYPTKGHETLRVVLIRAEKKDQKQNVFGLIEYDYHGFVTNMGQHEISAEKVIEFYRKRGNAENFIKEVKYGLDLKHFPCQKLLANYAYGVIAALAYSIQRFLSFIQNPKKQHFSKLLRRRMIFIPVQVVKHAREVIFKFSDHIYKEVQNWIHTIDNKFSFG